MPAQKVSAVETNGERQSLESLQAVAHARFRDANPVSARAHNMAGAHLPGGNTRSVLYAQPFPLAFKTAVDKTVTSLDGREYVDFLGEYSAGLFGHSHPKIRQAIASALDGGWNFGAETLQEKELASRITGRFSSAGLDLVRFTNSGTEANTMAIGTALAWTGRRKVLVFSNSYHGGTIFFPMPMCLWSHSGMSGPAPWRSVNLPHDFVPAPFNNIAETQAIVDALPSDSLAAVILEPIQGSGGCRPASMPFLRYLRETCDKLGALLIVDEVMTSRLGPEGYLATLGLQADLMTLGKWLGGGMSFGAFGGRRDVMSMYDPALPHDRGIVHAGTFNNNIFSMSAGIAALEVFSSDKVTELNKRGERMKAAITKCLVDLKLYPAEHAEQLQDVMEIDSFQQGGSNRILAAGGIKSTAREDAPSTLPIMPKVLITGRGSMLNVRFTGPDAAVWQNLYYHFMLEKGIYLASRGYTPLSLCITDEDVDIFTAAFEEFLTLHAQDLRWNEEHSHRC
jgi:glutamate-1-semialdehyde 2,1-aminomutase